MKKISTTLCAVSSSILLSACIGSDDSSSIAAAPTPAATSTSAATPAAAATPTAAATPAVAAENMNEVLTIKDSNGLDTVGNTYVKLRNNAVKDALATSTLNGVAVQNTGTNAAVTSDATTVLITHVGGKTVFDFDGGGAVAAIADDNGPDAKTGVIGETTDKLTTNNNAGVLMTGSYAFVDAYTYEYNDGTHDQKAMGVFGRATNADHIPETSAKTNIIATYTGGAHGVVGADALTKGTSVVTANFSAGLVDVTLSNFSGDGAKVIDTITAEKMVINGNQFANGTVSASLAGKDVALTGQNALGQFYGYDSATKVPDEVGGVVGATVDDDNDDIVIKAVFLAD